MHGTKISAEFEFRGHSSLGAHRQKCGVGSRRGAKQRRLSSLKRIFHTWFKNCRLSFFLIRFLETLQKKNMCVSVMTKKYEISKIKMYRFHWATIYIYNLHLLTSIGVFAIFLSSSVYNASCRRALQVHHSRCICCNILLF